MRASILLLLLMPGMAHAHVGHIGELAGHDHVMIGAALGAIALAGLVGALRGRGEEVEEVAEEDLAEA